MPQASLVSYLDASDMGSIIGHPGAVTSIADQSGNGNTALQETGNVLSGSSTINGMNSLQFDGNSFLGINDTSDINTSGQTQRSIFMTFETGNDINTRQVIYEEGGGANGYAIYLENGQVNLAAWRGGGATFDLVLSKSVAANNAYSTGFIFDSSGSGTFSGYLNGESIGSIPNTTAQDPHGGDIGIGGMNNASFFNGSGAGGDGFAYDGEIGELLIYNTALSDDQREQLDNFLINQRVIGESHDVFFGEDGDDALTGGSGNDTLNGGRGEDVAVYHGSRRDYTITPLNEGRARITDNRTGGGDGSDLLVDVEVLRFANSELRLQELGLTPTRDRKLHFLVGDQTASDLEVSLADVTIGRLFNAEALSLRNETKATEAFSAIHQAINTVIMERAQMGASLASTDILSSQLNNRLLQQQSAHSAIADTDIARESQAFALQTVKSRFSIAVLAQTSRLRSDLIATLLAGDELIAETASALEPEEA